MIGNAWVRLRQRGIFYGWWIVAAGIAAQALTTGLLMNAYGAYVAVMQAEFGWSRTTFSIAFSLQRVESGLLGPIQGWMLDRFGPRPVMTVGMILFGGGFMAFSQVNSIWSFYAIFLVMAVGVSMVGSMTVAAAVVNWFQRMRATAMGLSNIGLGMGGLVVPLVAWSLASYGWRTTAFVSGIIILIAGTIVAQFMRRAPEEYGWLPDGDTVAQPNTADADEASQKPIAYDDSEDFTAKEALKTPAFWLISGGHAMGVIVVTAVMVHAIIHMNEGLGYSLTFAATVIALLTGMQIVGNLIGGFIGDRMSKRILAAICLMASGIALVMLGWAEATIMVLGFAIIQGLSHGVRGVLMEPLRADYFGRKAFATINGLSSLVVMWGNLTGPIVAGVMADTLGDYRLAFTIMGLFVAAGSLCFVFLRRPMRDEPAATSV